MIVEERVYSLKVGATREYLRIYAEEGLEPQRRILGRMVGFFTTEVGTLHQVVHLWAYRDLDERERRRAQLAEDEGWRSFLARTRPLIERQKNRILRPAPFSPWFSDPVGR
jgi:NIPSNAP